MKLTLLVAALLLAATHRAQAQTAPVPAPVVTYRYCALVVRGSHFSWPEQPYLDYGQDAGVPVQDAALAEADTQIRRAKSVIAVLNYLGRSGWECIDVTTVPSETTLGRYITSETRYLLRQRQP